ncbi:sialic acid-binding Ig-like lectin 15 isoform X2 [Pelodiscus sinensis]
MDPRCAWLWAVLTGASLQGGSAQGSWVNGCWTGAGWSMCVPRQITGLRGESVVLPCNFTHPNPDYSGPIQVIWNHGVFQCQVHNGSTGTDSSDNCTAGAGRYRLAGDPRRGDLSLSITGLRFDDNRTYRCRVELTDIPGQNWEMPDGTVLTVAARPSIQNLSLLPESRPTRLSCTAEGRPAPNVTVLGPAGDLVAVRAPNATEPTDQTTLEVALSQNGLYTCRAENAHGWAKSSMSLGPQGSSLLPIILPLVLLLLLGLLLLGLYCRLRGRCRVPGRQPAAPAGLTRGAPDTGGKGSPGRAQPGKAGGCSPCQPAAHTQGLPPGQTLPQPGLGPHAGQPPASPAQNPDSCTYADLNFPGATAASRGPQPGAKSPPAPEEEVTYSELAPQRKPR